MKDQEDQFRHQDNSCRIQYLSLTNHAQRSPSLARSMDSRVMDVRASSPSLIPIIPPLKRKPCNFHNIGTHATIAPNTSVQTSLQLPMHNYAVAADTEDTPNRKITRPARSNRRTYVYQPPLPEINVLSPYSRQLVPPISIRCQSDFQ